MSLTHLDSRVALGSDIDRKRLVAPVESRNNSSLGGPWIEMQSVRVIRGRWGPLVRLSAPHIGVTADGNDFDAAWGEFVRLVSTRPDSPWLTFDVGPLRDDEIAQALDAPEDEAWSNPANSHEV